MSDEAKETTAAQEAWNRLSSCYLPPEVADVRAFRREFLDAMDGIDGEMVAKGVKHVINSRKSRAFPSIGEVREACLSFAPRTQGASYVDMGRVYASEDARKAKAIRMIAALPRVDDVIAKGYHSALLDWVIANERLPSKHEWSGIVRDAERANELLHDVHKAPPPHAGDTYVHITHAAAAAIEFRRNRIAEQIDQARNREAAE